MQIMQTVIVIDLATKVKSRKISSAHNYFDPTGYNIIRFLRVLGTRRNPVNILYH